MYKVHPCGWKHANLAETLILARLKEKVEAGTITTKLVVHVRLIQQAEDRREPHPPLR